jgi:hypothetical protein
MRLLTDDGTFLCGEPLELVAQLGAHTQVLVCTGKEGRRESMLMQLECDRIARYQHEVGPHFARFAADRLLDALEEEGLVLILR